MVDESFKADQAAIDAMIGDFRGQRFLSPPPDPRLIDPTLLRALSARLADPYAYQWRATRANADLVDALYHTVTQANGSRYGLQAGVFTESLSVVRRAVEGLEVGAVLINEVPTYRADHLPYGGVKGSGLGREGVRYAMEEYSERKTVVMWRG